MISSSGLLGWAVICNITIAIMLLSQPGGLLIVGSNAQTCTNSLSTSCGANPGFTCEAPITTNCPENTDCGIDFDRDYRSGTMWELRHRPFGNGNYVCYPNFAPAGYDRSSTLGVINEALYMFGGKTCFRLGVSTGDDGSSNNQPVGFTGLTLQNFTTIYAKSGNGNGNSCEANIAFWCEASRTGTWQIGRIGMSGNSFRTSYSSLCERRSSSITLIERETTMTQDLLVKANVLRAKALEYCNNWGGTLFRANTSSAPSMIATMLTNSVDEVWVGLNDQNKWTYDQTTYSSVTDPGRSVSGPSNLWYLKRTTATLDIATSIENRKHFACTRTLGEVTVTIPPCYTGINCNIKLTLSRPVIEAHTISAANPVIQYVGVVSGSMLFSFAIGSTVSILPKYKTSAGTYTHIMRLDGQGFRKDITFYYPFIDRPTIGVPTTIKLYKGKSNLILISKGSEGTVTLTTTSTTLTGPITISAFNPANNISTITITPSNAAGSSYELVLGVSSVCDCGEPCACYVSSSTLSSIAVADPIGITATVGTSQLLQGQWTLLSVNLPVAADIATSVTLQVVCGLQYSVSTLDWAVAAQGTQTINITTPASVTTVQTCSLSLVLSPNCPQFNLPAAIPLTVGPVASVSYLGLQPTMTQASPYTFQVQASRVYPARPVIVTPSCGTSTTFDPVSVTLTPSNQIDTFNISSTETACNFTVAFTSTGSPDFTVAPVTLLSFTAFKTIAVLVPPPMYIGQTTANTISISTTIVAAEVVTVSIVWIGPSGVVSLSSYSVTLDAANPVRLVTITTSGATGSGTFNFTVSTGSSSFDTNVPAQPFSVLPQVIVTSTPTTFQTNISTGTYFAKTITINPTQIPFKQGDTVTVSLNYPPANFYVPVSSLVWAGSDGSFATKDFTLTAITPVSAPSSVALSYTVTSTAPEFKTGTFPLGSTMTYTRFNISTPVSTITVYGAPVAFTVPVTVSSLPTAPSTSLVINTTYSQLDFSTPNATLSFVAGSGKFIALMQLQTLQTQVGGMTYELQFMVDSSRSTAGVPSLYDGRIQSTYISVIPYRSISANCNSTEIFFGPFNAVSCTFTIDALPPAASTLQLGFVPGSPQVFTSTPNANSYTTSTSITFTIVPDISALTFTDGEAVTRYYSVGDTSKQFNPAAVAVPLIKKKLRTISLTNPFQPLYVSTGPANQNPFIICATISTAPTGTENVSVSTTVAGLVPNVSTLVFTNASGSTICFSATSATATVYNLQLPISASPKYVTLTSSLTISVRPLETVSLSMVPSFLFVNQNTTITVTASSAVATGTLSVAVSITCGGTSGTSSLTPSNSLTASLTASTTYTILAIANGQCYPGVVSASVSGTTTIFDLATIPISNFEIKPLKTCTINLPRVSVYGGQVDSFTVGTTIGNLPNISGTSLRVSILDLSSPPKLAFSVQSFEFAADGTSNPASISTPATALSVTSSITTTIQLSFSGSALPEYAIPSTKTFTITILPIVNVTFAIDFSPAVIYVSPALTQTMTVTLPMAPSSGSVFVSPTLLDGSPSAVSFSPPTLQLNSSVMTAKFTILARAKTASSEALSVTYSGNAVGYFPQPIEESFPVTFKPLGVVRFLTAPPASIFEGQSFAMDVDISFTPPPSYGPVTLTISSSSSAALNPSVSQIMWTGGSAVQRTFTVAALQEISNVVLTFSLSAPPIYEASLNIQTAVITVASARSILLSVPKFVYVGQSVTGRIEIGVLPTGESTLTLAITPSNAQAVTISSLFDFISSSAKSQTFSVGALVASGNVLLSLSVINGAEQFDTPSPVTIEVRALDTVTAYGLTPGMYVGTSIVVTLVITRPPQCSSGGITVVPSFGSNDANFVPDAGVEFNVGSSSLSKDVVLTASQSSVGYVPLSIPISGTCSSIYAPVISNASSIRVFPKESVTLSSWSNMTSPSDGAYLVYIGNVIPIFIDLGTPAIKHTGVTVVLSFAGLPGSIALSPTTVVFPAGVNKSTVNLTGITDTAAADLSVSVSVGAGIFVPVGPIKVKVLRTIPISLAFVPSAQLIVQGRDLALDVTVGSVAVVGSMTVRAVYNVSGRLNSTSFEFKTDTADLTQRISLYGLIPSEFGLLTLQLSGTAGTFYHQAVSSYTTAVRPQRTVLVLNPPTELFLNPTNTKQMIVSLQSLPTVPGDIVTVTHTPSTSMTVSPTTVELTATNPNATLTIEGTAVGAFTLQSILSIRSDSNEYATKPNNTLVNIPVKSLLLPAITGYLNSMYVSATQTFTITLPRIPASPLEIRADLPGSLYPIGMTPTVLYFNATAGLLSQTMSLTATSDVLSQTSFKLLTTGSSEFDAIGLTSTLQVNPDNEIAVSGWRSQVYVGSTNAISFTVAIAKRPVGGNLTITIPPSEHFELSQYTFLFTEDNTTDLYYVATLRGMSASTSGELNLVVEMDDPTSFYITPLPLKVTILPLESYGGTVSSLIVFERSSITVTLILPKMPNSPMNVELTVEKNRTSNSLIAVDPSLYEVTPGTQQSISSTATTATFTLKPLTSPLTVRVGFRTSGSSTSEFFILTLPAFIVRFAPLSPITFKGPSNLYRGLTTVIGVSVPFVPTSGAISVVITPGSSGIVVTPDTIQFSSTTSSTLNFTVVATVNGFFTLALPTTPFSVTGFNEYTTPTSWTVQVQEPYPLDFIDPPLFNYILEQNKLSLAIDYGTLGPDEVLTVTLTSNASDYLSIFPSSVDVSTSSGIFQVYAYEPVWVMFNLTFISSARRVVMSPRLRTTGLIVNFRALKTITITKPPGDSATIGLVSTVSITISEKPSPGSKLLADLTYGGSPSNINLSPSTQWDSTTTTLTRILTFSGRSPTNLQSISVNLYNDPQYTIPTFSFNFRFEALLQMTVEMPLIVFINTTSTYQITVSSAVSLSTTLVPSPLNVFTFTPDTIGMALETTKSGSIYATQMRDVTISFTLGLDDAAKVAVPAPRSVMVATKSQVIVNAPSPTIVVYIKSTIYVRTRVSVAQLPATGSLKVTPQIICPAGQIVSFVPPFVFFNSTNDPSVLYRNIDIYGLKPSPACSLLYAVQGTGYTSSPQAFTVETRNLHQIQLSSPPTRVFLGTANRVMLNISLDPLVKMPLDDSISITFASDSPCLDVSPKALFWAPGNQEDHFKIAYVTALCAGTALVIRTTATHSTIFVNSIPATITLDALVLHSVSVVDSTSGSTDYFMFVGGAALDFDVTIPEALRSDESLVVTASYQGIQGSINIAPAVWVPSPQVPTSKKLLIQAVSVSPQAVVTFTVTGPPRFRTEANGDGRLEVSGPKRVVATVPTSLVVGQQVLVSVVIEDYPFPGETIIIQPIWEGSNKSLTWTPKYLVWTSATVGREQLIQFTAAEQSGNFNLNLDVSGSYRFVKSAYKGEVTITVPQSITTTQLPSELIRGEFYFIGINFGIIPSAASGQVFVRMQPQLDADGVECIRLASSQIQLTSSDPLAPVEQLVGVTVFRACPERQIDFTVLGAVDEYSRYVPPRFFSTYNPGPFAIDWPFAAYAGSESKFAVITLREVIFDEEYYANITIGCNGSATFQETLHWGYGSRSDIVIEIANNLTEMVEFNFTVTSNFLVGAVIPRHQTVFNPLIEVSRVTAVPSQIYSGDANKLKVYFNVTSLPRQLGNDPADPFLFIAESSSPEIVIQPLQLQWSADSPKDQFIYITGVSPTTAPATISFRVAGLGAQFVGSVPAAITVEVSPLLLIDVSIPPKEIYVGDDNKRVINITVPDTSAVTLRVEIGGDVPAFALSPQTISFPASRWRTFTVTGQYPTSRASYLLYTIVSAPTRIAMRTMAASESMSVLALRTVTRTPEAEIFKVVEYEIVSVALSPAVPGLTCSSSNPSMTFIGTIGDEEVRITPRSSGSAIIRCTSTDKTYAVIPEFEVVATTKKRVIYAAQVTTYLNIPGVLESQQKFAITLSDLPSKGMLVVEPVFDPTFVTFPLIQLQFGQFTAKTQYFFVKGARLTNFTNITLSFSGSIGEYDLSGLKPTNGEVINNLNVDHVVLGAKTISTGLQGYITEKNALRVQFQLPRQTLYDSIKIVPSSDSTVKFCVSVDSCVPMTLGNPLLIGSLVRVVAYIYSDVVQQAAVASFVLSGGVDFAGPATITLPPLQILPLEKIVVDHSTIRPILYFGGQNSQTLQVSISAPPLAGQSIELLVLSSTSLTLSAPILLWSTASTGAFLDPLVRDLTIAAISTGASQNVTLQYRDRTSVTSASNFEDTIYGSVISFNVLPLIRFITTIGSATLVAGVNPTPFVVYLTEINALSISVVLPTMPVLTSTVVKITVEVSNPDVFHASTTLLQFGNFDPIRSPARIINIFATTPYTKGANNTVTLRISGPPEYQQDVLYTFSVYAQPLLKLESSLTTDTVAIGTENAVSFEIWPPVPVSLTLGSIVTCGEVSFAATQQLTWEESAGRKVVTVAGTLPTTSTSSCFIRTPILSGAWASKFVAPPLDLAIWTRARPGVFSDVPTSTPGTTIRDNGMTFIVTLSEGGFWKFNRTATTVSGWIRDGLMTISSTRSPDQESRSLLAYLNMQMGGDIQVPLIQMTFISENSVKFSIGPDSGFYASAKEMITIGFTKLCTSTGVTLQPNQDAIQFEIRGKKEALIDSNVLGSGAASAAIAGGALSMGAATAAGKLQAIMNAFLCPNPDWRDQQNSIDWNEAPIPLSFGDNEELGTYTAVAFSNSVVVLCCFIVHMFVAYIVFQIRKRKSYSDKSFAAARATVRFPSLLLFPMLFFYQAVVSSSIKVVMYAPSASFRALGGLTLVLVGLGVPAIAMAVVGPASKLAKFIPREVLQKEQLRQMKRAEDAAHSWVEHNGPTDDVLDVDDDDILFPKSKSKSTKNTKKTAPIADEDLDLNLNLDEQDDLEEEGSTTSSINKQDPEDAELEQRLKEAYANQSFMVKAFSFMFQYSGEWTHPDKYWMLRFGMFFDEFRGGFKWFLMVDLGLTFSLGVIDGFEPKTKTECFARLSLTVVVFLVQWLTVVYWRPYINRFLNGFFSFAYFIQFLAMLLVAIALFNNTPQYDGVKVAVNLLIFFSALLMLKSVMDLFRVANEQFGLDTFFGDQNGATAVRIRVKTEAELQAVEREMLEVLSQREEMERQNILFGGHEDLMDNSKKSANKSKKKKYNNRSPSIGQSLLSSSSNSRRPSVQLGGPFSTLLRGASPPQPNLLLLEEDDLEERDDYEGEAEYDDDLEGLDPILMAGATSNKRNSSTKKTKVGGDLYGGNFEIDEEMNEYIEMGMAEEAMMRETGGGSGGYRRPSSSRRQLPSNSSSRTQSSDEGDRRYTKRKTFSSSNNNNNGSSAQAEGKKIRVFGNRNASTHSKYAHDVDDDKLPDFKWMKKTRL